MDTNEGSGTTDPKIEYWRGRYERTQAELDSMMGSVGELQVQNLQLLQANQRLLDENSKLTAVVEVLAEGINGVTASVEAATWHIQELNQPEGIQVYQ